MDERSAADIDLVRRGLAAWNARDLDELLACLAPNVEIDSALARSEGDGIYRGHDGAVTWHRNLVDTMDLTMRADQMLAYRGCVFALLIARVRGQESGVEMAHEYGSIFEIANGRIARLSTHLDACDALAAIAEATRGRNAG
jgi:ketosteroid isomerase-like protein